jgi:hypothetical protein
MLSDHHSVAASLAARDSCYPDYAGEPLNSREQSGRHQRGRDPPPPRDWVVLVNVDYVQIIEMFVYHLRETNERPERQRVFDASLRPPGRSTKVMSATFIYLATIAIV